MLRKTIVAGLVSLVSLVSTEALPAIASYPATQWSGTRFNASKDVCVSNATAALQANKFSEINSSGINVYGHTAQAVATIFCTPSNNAIYLIVVVSSNNSQEAERLHNQIRQKILTLK
jgi:hypothetical protein